MHETIKCCASAEFELEAAGPLLIGADVLAGSSIKGAVRHYIEENNTADADAIFGSAFPDARKSKIKFNDACAAEEALTPPPTDRYLGGFIFTNYTTGEMKAVLEAFRGINSGAVRFGGGLNRGFGIMRISSFRMEIWEGYDPELKQKNKVCFTGLDQAIAAFEKENALNSGE